MTPSALLAATAMLGACSRTAAFVGTLGAVGRQSSSRVAARAAGIVFLVCVHIGAGHGGGAGMSITPVSSATAVHCYHAACGRCLLESTESCRSSCEWRLDCSLLLCIDKRCQAHVHKRRQRVQQAAAVLAVARHDEIDDSGCSLPSMSCTKGGAELAVAAVAAIDMLGVVLAGQ